MTLSLAAQSEPPAPPAPEAAPTYKAGDSVKTPDHASRWEYPKEFQVPANCEVYFVVKGDTLWDLGQRFLGNPYAWPQIWELNKWIKDPHWIFPGNPLIIPSQAKAVAKASEVPVSTAPQAVADLQPDPSPTNTYKRVVNQEFAFTFQDFLQMPYLASNGAEAHLKEKQALRIVGAEHADREHFADGVKIFLDGGQDRGIRVGDRRVITKLVKQRFFHPDDTRLNKPMGDLFQQVGVARIVQVMAKGSVAMIERSLDGVRVGDYLLTYQEPASVPLQLRTDVTEPLRITQPRGKVIYIQDGKRYVGNGEQVIIDLGTKNGFREGDVLLTAIEDSWAVGDHMDVKRRDLEKTQRYSGQLFVVRASDHHATCRILRATDSVQIGSIVFK